MPSTSPNLIRGYLPLRVTLPANFGDGGGRGGSSSTASTFLFVKEHVSNSSSSSSRTLFVANAPLVPGVRTRLFLRSLFGRYGDVERVTVVRNPRRGDAGPPAAAASLGNDADDAAMERLFAAQLERFGDCEHIVEIDPNDEGKFAHVVFASNKDMKRALRSVGRLMAGQRRDGNSDDGDEEEEGPPAVRLGSLELQELADASEKLLRREQRAGLAGGDGAEEEQDEDDKSDSDDDNQADESTSRVSGIHALAERHRSAYVSRRKLLEACNAVMARYEDAEEEAERRARDAASQPDEDGFVTVVSSRAAAVVGTDHLEEDRTGGGGGGGRRKGSKRHRNKKESRGAAELKDFYRFQMKEGRKRGLQELRERFEADLAKVKKMKEEKKYRPF